MPQASLMASFPLSDSNILCPQCTCPSSATTSFREGLGLSYLCIPSAWNTVGTH
jgi:hypothetical protein